MAIRRTPSPRRKSLLVAGLTALTFGLLVPATPARADRVSIHFGVRTPLYAPPVYAQRVYYPPVYAAPVVRPVYRPYVRPCVRRPVAVRIWIPGFYRPCGTYAAGYWTTEWQYR